MATLDLTGTDHVEELPTYDTSGRSYIDRFTARFDYRYQYLAVEAFLDGAVWTVTPYPGTSIIQGKFDDTGTEHRYAELVFLAGDTYEIEDSVLEDALIAAGYIVESEDPPEQD